MHWIYFDYAKGDPAVFREAMQAEAQQIRDLLASRGVDYDKLKSALIPTAEGRQVAFLYDWRDDPSWNYAVAFAKRYLPHLREDLRTSVLQGDLLDIQGPMPTAALDEALIPPRDEAVNWQTQFAVYFSNLRHGDVEVLHRELSTEPRYSGYLDVTFAIPVRDFLERSLPSFWVMHDRRVILTHGGDDPLIGSEDPVGFDLPTFGYEVVSLLDSYFTGFLSYKIDATDAHQAGDDRILNLAAITGELIDLDAVDIVVPPDKLDKYLLRDESKLRLMTSIGLEDVTPEALSGIIRAKLQRSYVYDFRFAPDGTPLFAVSAEFEKPEGGLARRLLALKHDREHSAISLVTMY